MALVEVALFDDPIAGEIARAHLENEGIDAVLFDVQMSWVGSLIPVRLMVAEEDRRRAERLLSRPDAGEAE